ncbi:MAG: type IV secretory system conjugative DNA transfer family protein [Acidimicrobiales bacterium]
MRPPPPPISRFGTTPTDALTLSPGWGDGRGTVWYGITQGFLSPEGRVAQGDAGVLVIGPPRSGKTSGVIIPTVLAFDGPAVTASTKPDVLTAVGAHRQQSGRLWLFDPTGTTPTIPGVTAARWSPLVSVTGWDSARDVASQMVKAEDRSHNTHSDAGDFFRGRATDLLAVALYQAHRDGTGFDAVLETLSWPQELWAETARTFEEAMADTGHIADLLASQAAKRLAGMAPREYSGTIGTASNTLAAYQRTSGLNTTTNPNFNPEQFATSGDTLFIVADGAHMAEVAPIVVALVDTITRTRYRLHTIDPGAPRLLLALDEIANLCPLPSITSMWSEAGGQGVTLLAAVQDMTQVTQRWGADHGWLSLATQKFLLPGIADHDTLHALSDLQGEYEHHRTTHTRGRGWGATDSESDTYTWRPNIPIDTYTRIPAGTGRLIVGATDHGLITLTPAHTHPLWANHIGPPQPRTLTQLANQQPAVVAGPAPAGSFADTASRQGRR